MLDEQRLWERIQRHAGEPFETKTGKSFTYDVPQLPSSDTRGRGD